MAAKPGEQTNWRTKSIPLQGGMRFDLVPVLRDSTAPGSLIDSQNFQSGVLGGYQRIYGYALWDTNVVPGTGRIQDVAPFKLGVMAARAGLLYYSTGLVGGVYSGWGASLNPVNVMSTTNQIRHARYQWSERRVTFVDGVGKPLRWNGTTLTALSNATSAATYACEYNNALFLAVGSTLYGSAPSDDTTWTGGTAYSLVFGDTITGLRVFRGDLWIFGTSSIGKLNGSSQANYVFTKITSDIGCPFPDTIQECAGNVMFLAPDGVRLVSGTARIGDSNLAAITNPVKSYVDTQVAAYIGNQITATIVESRSQYRLFFSNSTDTASPGLNCCLINTNPTYYSEGDVWEFFKLNGFQVSACDHGVLSDGTTQLTVHGDYSGNVFKQDSGNSFNGSNISAKIQLPYLVFDDPGIRKVLYKLRLYVTVDGNAVANLTAQMNFDDNDPTIMQPPAINMTSNFLASVAIYGFSAGAGTRYGTAVYGQGAASNYLVNPIGGGFDLSLTVSSNDKNPSYTLKTAIADYAIEARQ